jgi:hypothetical protein
MVVDRMAGAGERTDQVLAFYSSGPDHTERVGETSQTPLDYRTRLPRAEARVGTGTLRRSGLARFSPSRHLMHRRLRLPRRGKKSFFPLRKRRSTGLTRHETFAGVPPPRLAACGLNVTILIPSRPYEFRLPNILSSNSPPARFVAEGACDCL